MSEHWRSSTWGEEISLEYGKSNRTYNTEKGRFRVYGSNGPIGWTDTALVNEPGVVLGRKGAYRGVQFSKTPFFVIDTAYYVKPKNSNDIKWLYYAIISDKLGEIDDGSPIPSTTRSAVYVREIDVPPIKEQKAIASILGSLDDKIDLNRRTNETLEAMARALFRDWFVDFGPTRAKMAGEAPYLAPELWELFPDGLDEEGKPEGWKTEPLDETATFLNGLALQKYPATGDTSLPAIKIVQLRSENTETADPVSPDIPDDYIIEQNDLLFSWSGSLLCKFWNGQRGALNQHLFKVTSKRFEPWFIYEWIQFYMPEFQAIAAAKATTMGHIQRRHLTESLVTIPPANIMQPANKAIGSLIEQIQSNNGQSRTLAQLRDLLLPKLMSGEISIRDAEKMVEDAA
ncbi:MAG: restriction endonuclease subunit S [Acetobacter malorum]|uniref:restriction endonuclease subunit S n=1 Tax=Acetobacter malorum TaxID=178901 RepID=UPI0039E94F98